MRRSLRSALPAALYVVLTFGVGAGMLGQIPARANEGPDSAPVLSESLQSGVYRLQGGFEVSADPHLVWQVLTDFEGMPRFVPSIRSSVSQALPDGGLLVAQEFEGKVFIFTRTLNVRLVVELRPEQAIAFRDTGLRDFDAYEGSWQIQPSANGRNGSDSSKVIYRLTAKPRESVPGIVGRGAFKDGATQMLVELRNEMVRRSAQQSTPQPKLDQPEGGTK